MQRRFFKNWAIFEISSSREKNKKFWKENLLPNFWHGNKYLKIPMPKIFMRILQLFFPHEKLGWEYSIFFSHDNFTLKIKQKKLGKNWTWSKKFEKNTFYQFPLIVVLSFQVEEKVWTENIKQINFHTGLKPNFHNPFFAQKMKIAQFFTKSPLHLVRPMTKIALWKHVCAEGWAAESAIKASNVNVYLCRWLDSRKCDKS